MTVKLNKEAFKLYGTCDECGGKLYCIDIESGTAVCWDCEEVETFDPKEFTDQI